MDISCPQCGKKMALGEKVRENLLSLAPGQKARIKCAACGVPVSVDPAQVLGVSVKPLVRGKSGVKPPSPPDVRWLQEGYHENREIVEEVPRSLLLIPPGEACDLVQQAVLGLGYQVETAATIADALEKIEFVSYASIFLHQDFEPGPLADGRFYQSMCAMNMAKRRYIFFVLIGKELHTLYNLQALALSANLTVREDDLPYLTTILRKAIPDYEDLFGPFMEELRIRGK